MGKKCKQWQILFSWTPKSLWMVTAAMKLKDTYSTPSALVGCMRQVLGPGALGRPRGIGCRGRWEGGSGWGTHVNPWLIHVNVWQKPLQYCKVISLQLIKINGKKIRHLLLGRKAMTNLDGTLEGRDIIWLTKVSHSQSCGFSNHDVWMWELDHKEGWVLRNWCF